MVRFTRSATRSGLPGTAGAAVFLLIPWLIIGWFGPAKAEAAEWTDPAGDVTLPNADIISGSATVSGDLVDLRVRFVARPYPLTATHHITWSFDTDQNPATGIRVPGMDRVLTISGGLDALSTGVISICCDIPGLDASSHLWYDPATHTLRLLFPLALLSDDGDFNYYFASAFGGSFGANEYAPNLADLRLPGGFFTSDRGEPPPFNGYLVSTNHAPVCSAARAEPAELWPPNHSLVPIEIVGVTDPDGGPVTIAITGVTQNEPLAGLSDGDECPDAVIEGGRASVRAERSADGNGRAYTIAYTATDSLGSSCAGTVQVCVPHDRGSGACQDDCLTVNSLGSCSTPPLTGTWTAPRGNVSVPNADIVSGSATVSRDMVDLRVAFAAPPFPTTNTHHISWCLDTDQNTATGGRCGFNELLGADRGIGLDGNMAPLSACVFSVFGDSMISSISQVWYDPETYTVRLLFPLASLCDDGVFDYVVVSAFGGSGGANDGMPQSPNFRSGRFLTSDVGELPPFNGTLLCEKGVPRPLQSPLGRPAADIRSDGTLVRGGRATLELSLIREMHVVVALYDMLGREVATLDDSRRDAGSHRVGWNTSAFAPGMYFYRVRAGGVMLSRPVLILR